MVGNYICVDVETTGLRRLINKEGKIEEPEIVQLSLILVDEKDKILKNFTKILRVEKESEAHALEVHGITKRQTDAAAPLSSYKNEIKKMFDANVTTIVAHNIAFDFPILKNSFFQNGIVIIWEWMYTFCTLDFFRKNFQKDENNLPNYKLSTIYNFCTQKELENSHDAGADATALVDIIKFLKNKKARDEKQQSIF